MNPMNSQSKNVVCLTRLFKFYLTMNPVFKDSQYSRILVFQVSCFRKW